jgi:hypothetical protein
MEENTEKKKRVRRPTMQVLLARAEAIHAKLTKIIGGEPQTSASLVTELRRMVAEGIGAPKKKDVVIPFEAGRAVNIKDGVEGKYLEAYSELELNTMVMDHLVEPANDNTVVVFCKTSDRNVLAELRHLEHR